MALGTFLVLLLLLAAVDVNQLNFSAEKGIVREKERGEKILQRLKEREVNLQLLHSRLKKQIADLEAKQGALTLALQRKIQQIQCMRKVFFLATIMVLSLWG